MNLPDDNPQPDSPPVRFERRPPRRPVRRRLGPLLLAFVLLALLGAGVLAVVYWAPRDRWGDKFRAGDNLDVYYGPGVSRAQAEKVGQVLLDEGFGKEHPATVRVVREKDRYEVFFFVNYDRLSADDLAGIKENFDGLKDHLRGQVFDDTPVAIKLCDQEVQMTPFHQLKEPRVRLVIE